LEQHRGCSLHRGSFSLSQMCITICIIAYPPYPTICETKMYGRLLIARGRTMCAPTMRNDTVIPCSTPPSTLRVATSPSYPRGGKENRGLSRVPTPTRGYSFRQSEIDTFLKRKARNPGHGTPCPYGTKRYNGRIPPWLAFVRRAGAEWRLRGRSVRNPPPQNEPHSGSV